MTEHIVLRTQQVIMSERIEHIKIHIDGSHPADQVHDRLSYRYIMYICIRSTFHNFPIIILLINFPESGPTLHLSCFRHHKCDISIILGIISSITSASHHKLQVSTFMTSHHADIISGITLISSIRTTVQVSYRIHFSRRHLMGDVIRRNTSS